MDTLEDVAVTQVDQVGLGASDARDTEGTCEGAAPGRARQLP